MALIIFEIALWIASIAFLALAFSLRRTITSDREQCQA
jgi:hypothetical protein